MIKFAALMANFSRKTSEKFTKILNYSENNEIFVEGGGVVVLAAPCITTAATPI